MKKILTIMLALAVCAALWLSREKEPQYRVTAVQVRNLSERIEAVGSVAPQLTCALMPSVAGRITRVFVEDGQYVGKGQAIAEVELLPENAAAYLTSLQNAQLSKAEMQERMLAMCTVTAPQAGEVTGLAAYEGLQTAPGSILGYVTSDALCVASYVPENLREDIYEGQKADIRRGSLRLDAVIERITPATEANGQYLLRIVPTESTRTLEKGMKVDVEIAVDTCTAPSVPLQALQPDGTLLCRTEGGVAAVPVQTGLCTETYAQLLSGPPVGTEVIIGEVE